MWIVASRENIRGVGAIIPETLTSACVDIVVIWVFKEEKCIKRELCNSLKNA